jgi:non-ribosomal peptide synthetase component F
MTQSDRRKRTDSLMYEALMLPVPIAPAEAIAPDAPYARDELLHEILAATAARDPAAPALRLTDPDPEVPRRSVLTYGELRQRSSRFAHFLRARGIRRGDRVVICLPRGLDQYLALLGVLEAGAAYVPMDWSVPQDRADYVCADATAALVVTREERASAFRAHGVPVLDMDAELGDIAASPDTPLSPRDNRRGARRPCLHHLHLGLDRAAQGRGHPP